MAQVGSEAVGRVRILRHELAEAAAQLDNAIGRLPAELIRDAALKTGLGGAKAWRRLLQLMPIAPFQRQPRAAIWRLLRPGPALMVDDQGMARGDDTIAVHAMIVGLARGQPIVKSVPWAIAYSSHSIGRLVERSRGGSDPVAAMLEAHDALLGASSAAATTMLKERQWTIPAGMEDGSLPCAPSRMAMTALQLQRREHGFRSTCCGRNRPPRSRRCGTVRPGPASARDCCGQHRCGR